MPKKSARNTPIPAQTRSTPRKALPTISPDAPLDARERAIARAVAAMLIREIKADLEAEAAAAQHAPSDAPTPSPWITTKEAALYLRRGRDFIMREIRAGRLRAAVVSGRGRGEVLTRREWLDQWVEERLKPTPYQVPAIRARKAGA